MHQYLRIIRTRNTKMAFFKFYSLFMVLILVQAAHAKPFDDTSNFFDSEEEEIRRNPTPAQKLLLYTYDNLVSLGKSFASNAVNASRYILKDEALIANAKPECMEFKKNLTVFVEQFENTKNPLLMWDILDIYTNTTDNYTELPADKVTPESEVIVGILNKYDCKALIVKFGKEFLFFMDNFVKMFEENKTHLDKPMLDWFEKYCTLENIDEKIDAFGSFIELA